MSGPKSQVLSLKISGLYTDPNTFSEVPPGITLASCSNVVLDRDSIVSSRRGLVQYGISPSGTGAIQDIFDFKDVLITRDVNGVMRYDSVGDGSVWTPYSGTYIAPSGSTDRAPSTQSNKNIYIGTDNGVYKLENPTNALRLAGAPRGLGGTGATSGLSGFMSTNSNVAYRLIWGYRDENENLILGAPSDRIVVTNTSGFDRDVALSFFIPQLITTDYFYQVYRSAGSATAADPPDDELQLVYESSATAGEITAGVVSIIDSTPNDLRGVTIYTAPSLSTQGILGANVEPPFANALCTFQNTTFYGNTRTKHSFNFTLISVGSPDGVQVNDTLTITAGVSTFTITGKAAENAAAGEFLVQSALTPAENIDITARSIIKVINTLAANTFIDAYYVSTFEETPGTMFFQRIDLSTTAFTVVSNRDTCWRPVLPSSGSTYNNTSRNEVRPNRVYFSKLQEPEAVPVLNYLDIGDPEAPIEALVPLRDGVIVLKTDGVFRISGFSGNSFSVSPLDTTVRITAPHSWTVLSNKVFLFSSQGVVAVSDTSAEIVSRAIESDVVELSSALYPNFATQTFAVGYESDRKYILWTITTAGDTSCTQAFVYNTLSGDWTRWTKPATIALVKQSDDRLYTAGIEATGTEQFVFQERKNFNLTDFVDEQFAITVTSAVGDLLNVTTTARVLEGYVIEQGTAQAVVTSVVSGTQLQVETVEDWVAGAAVAFRPIDVVFDSNPFDAGEPASMKHWADCSMIFRATDFTNLRVFFAADTTAEAMSITLVPPRGTGGWGAFPWGERPWGVSQSAKARLRANVPKRAMRSNWISIGAQLNECFTDLNLAGISLTFSPMSSRQKGNSRE